MFNMRRAVVAGGAGFVGSHLCDRLLIEGYNVFCIDNLSSGRIANIEHLVQSAKFQFVEHDVTEEIHLPGSVDVVYNLASAASPRDYFRYPIETLLAGANGTLHTVKFAHIKNARYVLSSTSEVYGSAQIHPQDESYWGYVNPVGPRSAYDEAKRYAEALVTAFRIHRHVNALIVRIFNTYGPRMRPDDGRAVPNFISQALSGEPITLYGPGSQTRSLCYIDDLIEGLVRAADSTLAGPINLGNPHEVTIREVAELVIALSRSKSSIQLGPSRQDDPGRRCPEIDFARSSLQWYPRVSLVDGLSRTVQWFMERGDVKSPS